MKYKIDTDTLNEAENCRYNYSCLNDSQECLCDIIYAPGNGKVLFLRTENKVNCQYMLLYGKFLHLHLSGKKKDLPAL
ncbi:MAG: hypothetical protein AMK71_11380 [Nitrospira bacterium SG8_35_4]|nr:MAG: hypothetical protein AMK71_11380 [Nitrospira bacterium SG8_35_4]